ncbi:MAG: histidine kinase N-terminal 7TM domain-containing protein, partial [Thermoanaerobaculia bacterium]|nr:histidine kinase N-terminal 7TM domain-containing protein [Thermoanaerobaculia bacterium]
MAPVALSLLLAVALSSALAGYVLRRRSTPAVPYFAMIVVCAAIWCAAAAAEIFASSTASKFFFARLAFFGVAPLPAFFLLFALEYAGEVGRRARGFAIALFVVPAATLAVVWSNPQHGLMWSEVVGSTDTRLLLEHGVWYRFVHLPYTWLVLAVGEAALVRHLVLAPSHRRPQALMLVAATLVPALAGLLHTAGLQPLAGVDPAPLAFNLAAVFVVWGLFAFGMLASGRVDYETVLHSIDDAVLLVDSSHRVSMANPAAAARLGRSASEIVGRPLVDVLERWADSVPEIESVAVGSTLTLEEELGKPELQARVYPLPGRSGRARGRVVLLQEVKQQRAVDRLEKMAYRDFLTGLSNRHAFFEAAEKIVLHASRQDSEVAVIILDLDGFKEVNDSLGHAAGDELLDMVARRLKSQVRSGDLLARLGGDEFALLVVDCSTEQATHTVHRLVRAIKHHQFEVKGAVVSLDVSAGIAMFPGAGRSVEELLTNADSAMYQAKQGIGGLCFYDRELDTYNQELQELERELRTALDSAQLVFHYQPIVSTDTRVVTGVEALVRWQHPQRGLTAPSTFLPKLKERGLSRELDRHILKLVLSEMAASPWPIAINLSTESVVDPELPKVVAETLSQCDVEPDHVILEISEQGLADPDRARPILLALSELGVRLAADDFGMGYSSLAYLHHFPLDFLKLDRYLV